MSFDVGSIEASLTLDRSRFTKGLDEAKVQATSFAKDVYKAALGLDLEQFERDITTAKRQLSGLNDETVNVRLDTDSAELKKLKTQLEASDAEIEIKGDDSDYKRAAAATKTENAALDRLDVEIPFRADRKNWLRGYKNTTREARILSALRPQMLVSMKNDPVITGAKLVKRLANEVGMLHPKVRVSQIGAGRTARDMNMVARATDKAGNAFSTFYTVSTGRDGSKFRRVTKLATSIANLGGEVVDLASGAAGAVGPLANLATSVGGGGGGGIGGMATSAAGGFAMFGLNMAKAVVQAWAMLTVIGLLLAAISPLVAIISTGVGVIGAFAGGLSLLGVTAGAVIKDMGTLNSTQREVANAQIALNEAKKKGGEITSAASTSESNYTSIMAKQLKIDTQLAKEYTALENAKAKGNPQAEAAAQKNLNRIKERQEQINSELTRAYEKLEQARSKDSSPQVIAQEKKINSIKSEQTKIDGELAKAYDKLERAKSIDSNPQVAAQQQKIAKIKGEQAKIERELSSAFDRLDTARNPDTSAAEGQANAKINALKRQQLSIDKQLGAQYTKLSAGGKGFATAQARINDLKAKDQRISEQLTGAYAQLEKAQNPDTARDTAQVEARINQLKTRDKQLSDSLGPAYDKLSRLRKQAGSSQIQAQEKKIADLKARDKKLSDSLGPAYDKLTKLRKQAGSSQVQAQEQKIAKLKAEDKKLTNQLEPAYDNLTRARQTSANPEVQKHEQRIAQLKKDDLSLTKRLDKETGQVGQSRQDASSPQIQAAEKRLAEAKNDQAIAIKRMGKNSQDYKNALRDLRGSVKAFGKEFKTSFSDAKTTMATLMTRTVKWGDKQLPALGREADQVGNSFANAFEKGYDKGRPFKRLIDNLDPIMGDLGGTTKNTGSAFNSFMLEATPYVKRFTGWLEDASKRLASWMDSEAGRKRIRQFLDQAVPMARKLGDFFKEVGGQLFKLGKEHGPTVVKVIGGMKSAMKGFFYWTDKALDLAKKLIDIYLALRQMRQGGRESNEDFEYVSGYGWAPKGWKDGAGGKNQRGEMAHENETSANWHVFSRPKRDQRKNRQPPPIPDIMGRAHGGDNDMARGGNAHYVTNSTYMNTSSGDTVNYGEALRGGNREYAFPMGGNSWRYITEQSGYDKNSHALWSDLGRRKGYLKKMATGGDYNFRPPPNDDGVGSNALTAEGIKEFLGEILATGSLDNQWQADFMGKFAGVLEDGWRMLHARFFERIGEQMARRGYTMLEDYTFTNNPNYATGRSSGLGTTRGQRSSQHGEPGLAWPDESEAAKPFNYKKAQKRLRKDSRKDGRTILHGAVIEQARLDTMYRQQAADAENTGGPTAKAAVMDQRKQALLNLKTDTTSRLNQIQLKAATESRRLEEARLAEVKEEKRLKADKRRHSGSRQGSGPTKRELEKQRYTDALRDQDRKAKGIYRSTLKTKNPQDDLKAMQMMIASAARLKDKPRMEKLRYASSQMEMAIKEAQRDAPRGANKEEMRDVLMDHAQAVARMIAQAMANNGADIRDIYAALDRALGGYINKRTRQAGDNV